MEKNSKNSSFFCYVILSSSEMYDKRCQFGCSMSLYLCHANRHGDVPCCVGYDAMLAPTSGVNI